MTQRPLTVAWISYFPIEWLPGIPESLHDLPKQHPGSWQRVLLEQFEKRTDLKLHVIALRKQFKQDMVFERNGVTFHLIKTPGGIRSSSVFWVDTILIKRALSAIKPDIVHAWGTERGAGLVANRLGYPRVVTIQGLMSWYGTVTPPHWYDRLTGALERYSLARAPLATTEARFTVEWLRQQFPRLQVMQAEHAPDPVFHKVQRQPQKSPIRFIAVGALDHRKGGDVLCLALDRLRNEIPFELIVVGKRGQDVKEILDNKVSPEFWKQVTFKNNLTHIEMAEELKQPTMMICASRADVSPNSVKEGVVAGMPVIGAAVGGIPDYVWPNENGYLCSPGDVQSLIDAIRLACRHPLFKEGRVDADALVRGRDYLSPVRMGERFWEVYQMAKQQRR